MKAFRYLLLALALAVPATALADRVLASDADCCHPGAPCCQHGCPHCPR